MAISQAVANSYKVEIPAGVHLSTDNYYIALYTSAAVLDKNTTTYTGVADQVSNIGTGYTTGGQLLAGFTITLAGDTAIIDWTPDPTWLNVTFTARGALIYNDSLAGKNAVLVLDFGADKSVAAGTFIVQFPAIGAATGLIRLL